MTPSHDGRAWMPDTVDMRDALWPVEDVGLVAASAASAVATALEYHCNRTGAEPTNLSSMFIHYNARLSAGHEGSNTGTTVEAAMTAIATYGACPEDSWPFDPVTLAVRPPAHAYEEARRFAAIDYFSPADPLEALALRYPVPFAARLPERCLREAGRTGVMTAPTSDERDRSDGQTNHALVLVGYDKIARTFIARNCWGTAWGNEGHCTIAFDTMEAIAPSGSQRLWIITAPAAGTVASQAAATGPRTTADPPVPPPAPQPERLADLAARMRESIRGDLQRDLAEASRRITDLVGRTHAPTQPVGGLGACPTCSGNGRCPTCVGRGCTNCSGGHCPRCGGQGTA